MSRHNCTNCRYLRETTSLNPEVREYYMACGYPEIVTPVMIITNKLGWSEAQRLIPRVQLAKPEKLPHCLMFVRKDPTNALETADHDAAVGGVHDRGVRPDELAVPVRSHPDPSDPE